MNNIGWVLLLILFSLIWVGSTMLFFGVWVCVEVFLGAAELIRKTIRAVSGREAFSDPSTAREEDEDEYWKAS